MNNEMCKGCKYLEDEKCDVGHPCVNGSEYTPHSYHTGEELINQLTNEYDLMQSINCAIWEEKRKAYSNMETFNRDEITIMATAKAIFMITGMLGPYVKYYVDGQTRCLGCNLKMVDGDDIKVYIAREIQIPHVNSKGVE